MKLDSYESGNVKPESFSNAISNAIKHNFPESIQIKCLFHFVQALVKKLKKLGLYKKENYEKNLEILYNIKFLIFIEPGKIKKAYLKIQEEYGDEDKYGEFFKYFRNQWKPFGKKAKIKFTPIWNNYDLIKGKEFDKNHFFLTNNISESINHILNSYFIKKYPTFNEWRNASLTEIEKNTSAKGYEIRRNDHITKILLYIFNSAKKNEEFDIVKIDKIKKINSIILPA